MTDAQRVLDAATSKFGGKAYVSIARCSRSHEDARCSDPNHLAECEGSEPTISVGTIVNGTRRVKLRAFSVDDMLGLIGSR